MASWGVHPTVNAVCFVRNEGEGLRWSTRCSERACKWADAMARAGKGDKYVSKGDYPACKKKPSLRVLAAADAIRKANLTLRQLDRNSSLPFTFRPEASLSLPDRNSVYPISSTEPHQHSQQGLV